MPHTDETADLRPRRRPLEALLHDLRFALRTLRRSPGYTCAAVGVLALGIGANTAIFSVLQGVLFAPLPFRQGERLVLVRHSAPGSEVTNAAVSIPELAAYRERLHSVRDLVEYHGMSFTLLKRGEPDRVATGVVSANFFSMLGIKPLLGRDFTPGDEVHGAEAVLLLSYPYWQQKFGGDPKVVGAVVEMNNRPHTVIGVLPDFPQYPRGNDVYMPTSACPFRDQAQQTLAGGFRTFAGLTVFGRLTPGATPRGASAEVGGVAATFPHQHAADYENLKRFEGHVEGLQDNLVRQARPLLLALAATAVLVLLIACANVANLSIARTARRTRELAVRSAIGADRLRLLAQLLTESVVVAFAGGLLGLLVAWASRAALVAFIGRFTSRSVQIALDWRVLAFALATSMATGLLFGAAPALAARRQLMQAFRSAGAQGGEAPGRQRLRSGLVIAQVAISFVLLVGATLMLRSFHRLATAPLGYDTEHVMSASVYGNFTSVTPERVLQVNSDILTRLQQAPGVESAAVTASVPLSNISPGVQTIHFERRGQGEPEQLQADPNTASEGYFETLGIPVVAGRSFLPTDTAERPQVAVINRSMAALWHGASPIGARFQVDGAQPLPGQDPWVTVIGVVPDFQLYAADQPVPRQYYLTFRQNGGFAGRVLLRTHGDPHALIPVIKDVVHGVDPGSPVEELQTIAELRQGQLAAPKVTATLLAVFAGIALLVTLSGIAGVIGTAVTQRTRELGVRMALGATRGELLQRVVGQGVALVVAGLVIGVAGALGFSRLLSRYLFAIPPTDLASYGSVVAVFVVAAVAATLAPARRATAIQPQIAFRVD